MLGKAFCSSAVFQQPAMSEQRDKKKDGMGQLVFLRVVLKLGLIHVSRTPKGGQIYILVLFCP